MVSVVALVAKRPCPIRDFCGRLARGLALEMLKHKTRNHFSQRQDSLQRTDRHFAQEKISTAYFDFPFGGGAEGGGRFRSQGREERSMVA